MKSAEAKGCDINTVVQSYNYGGGFIDYVSSHGKKYTFELAVSFAKDKSGGVKVTYKNEISIKENGGWRYKYGNMFYVKLVSQYLAVPSFSDATAQAIFNEALKYQGWKYVYGGSNPNTSFDCSGLVQWCYGKLVSAYLVPHRHSMTLRSTYRCHRQRLVIWCSSTRPIMPELRHACGNLCRKQQNVSRWRPYRICRFNKLVLAATLDWCWTGENQIRKEWCYAI